MKNILFLLIDCLRADRCFGENRTAKTPTINWLCQNGTSFTQVISSTSTTTPNVASILTGMYPFQHGIRSLTGYKLSSNIVTLPEILRGNGYHTYAQVTGPLTPETGLNRGFDEYIYRDSSDDIRTAWEQELIDYLRRLKEPWFLFVHFWALHEERTILPKYNSVKYGKTRYDRALSGLDRYLGKLLRNIDLQNTLVALHGDHGENVFENPLQKHVKAFLARMYKPSQLIRIRIQLVKFYRKVMTDSHVAKDGYLAAFEHGDHIYDYLIKVPLIFSRGNLFAKNRIITEQVRQIDIFPTITELFIEDNSNYIINGRSLLPLINGESHNNRKAYIEGCSLLDESLILKGIRTSKWKYIFSPKYHKEELYDLKNDPKESVNLASKFLTISEAFRKEVSQAESTDALSQTEMSLKEKEALERRLRELGYI